MNETPTAELKNPRSKRWWRFLGRLVVVIFVLVMAVYFTRDFWSLNLRAWFMGRLYLASQDYGLFLPPVDDIEILALGGEVPKGTPDSFPPDLGPRLGTVNRHTIRGAEAESLAVLWRDLDFDLHHRSLCHHPFYALRFRHQGKLILETSVCWQCGNITLPVGYFDGFPCGFDAKSENGQKLLSMLSQYAPHPPVAQ